MPNPTYSPDIYFSWAQFCRYPVDGADMGMEKRELERPHSMVLRVVVRQKITAIGKMRTGVMIEYIHLSQHGCQCAPIFLLS